MISGNHTLIGSHADVSLVRAVLFFWLCQVKRRDNTLEAINKVQLQTLAVYCERSLFFAPLDNFSVWFYFLDCKIQSTLNEIFQGKVSGEHWKKDLIINIKFLLNDLSIMPRLPPFLVDLVAFIHIHVNLVRFVQMNKMFICWRLESLNPFSCAVCMQQLIRWLFLIMKVSCIGLRLIILLQMRMVAKSSCRCQMKRRRLNFWNERREKLIGQRELG